MSVKDEVLGSLRILFGDVVPDGVWQAFAEDERPLEDIDGELGDLLDEMLAVGSVSKAVTVQFEPGLRPVLKHGSHDQSAHGRRGSGRRQSVELPGATDANVGFAGLTPATARYVADAAAERGVSVRAVEAEYERRIEVARNMPDPYRPGMTAYEGGMDWYSKEANDFANAISPGDPAVGSGVLSALSPQNPWPSNKNSAACVMDMQRRKEEFGLTASDTDTAWAKYKEIHKEYGNTGPVTKPNFDQAWAIANGASIDATLTGRKRRNFHNNILGDSESVTVDVHMMKALSTTPGSTIVGKKEAEKFWQWSRDNSKSAAKKGQDPVVVDGVGYSIAAQATINVARRTGLEPRQVQAIVWNTCVTEKWARPPKAEESAE